MRWAVCLLLVLAGCTDPRLNAGISVGAGGVSVYPSVSGRVGGVGMALVGSAACFFVLKAATLAHVGEARFQGGMAAAEHSAGVQLWLRGIDPVTRVLADVIVAAPAEQMRTDS